MPDNVSFRFALTPKWIFGHLLALVAVVGFINLGLWQLHRHDERAARNAVIESRAEEGPVEWGSFLESSGESRLAREFRLVSVAGEYLPDQEILWEARTLDGRSGHDVLTPLLVDGNIVLVDRGWVPIDATGPPVIEARPSQTDVTLVAIVREGGASGLASARTDRILRIDLGELQARFELPLLPFYLLLTAQQPPQDGLLPVMQPAPETDTGPHLSYAVQWFVFAAIAAIGYPVLLRKTSRTQPGARSDQDQPHNDV